MSLPQWSDSNGDKHGQYRGWTAPSTSAQLIAHQDTDHVSLSVNSLLSSRGSGSAVLNMNPPHESHGNGGVSDTVHNALVDAYTSVRQQRDEALNKIKELTRQIEQPTNETNKLAEAAYCRELAECKEELKRITELYAVETNHHRRELELEQREQQHHKDTVTRLEATNAKLCDQINVLHRMIAQTNNVMCISARQAVRSTDTLPKKSTDLANGNEAANTVDLVVAPLDSNAPTQPVGKTPTPKSKARPLRGTDAAVRIGNKRPIEANDANDLPPKRSRKGKDSIVSTTRPFSEEFVYEGSDSNCPYESKSESECDSDSEFSDSDGDDSCDTSDSDDSDDGFPRKWDGILHGGHCNKEKENVTTGDDATNSESTGSVASDSNDSAKKDDQFGDDWKAEEKKTIMDLFSKTYTFELVTNYNPKPGSMNRSDFLDKIINPLLAANGMTMWVKSDPMWRWFRISVLGFNNGGLDHRMVRIIKTMAK
jgi:hypothetical protein